MKKKLLIHIGTGKTGSSAIQSALKGLKSERLFFEFRKNASSIKRNPQILLDDLSQIKSEYTIFSSEWLFRLNNREKLRRLALSLLSNYDVEVLLYVRRQDRWAVSKHNQAIRNRNFNAVADLQIDLENNWLKRDCDYYEVASRWADFFGDERVTVREYDRRSLIGADIVKDFCDAAGIDLNDINYYPENRNQSRTLEELKVKGLLAKTKSKRARKIFMNNIIAEIKPIGQKILPTKSDAQRFYGQYKESNRRLNERFNVSENNQYIFDEDFSDYPVESKNQWSEADSDELIVHILNAAKRHVLDGEDIKHLKCAAEHLRGVDIITSRGISSIIDRQDSIRKLFDTNREWKLRNKPLNMRKLKAARFGDALEQINKSLRFRVHQWQGAFRRSKPRG